MIGCTLYQIKKDLGNGICAGQKIYIPLRVLSCPETDEQVSWTLSVETLIDLLPDYFEEVKPIDNSKPIQACKESEEHWIEDIYLPLLRGETTGLVLGSGACALCKISHFPGNDCDECPLGKIGHNCLHDKSVYGIFTRNRTARNALKMIETIQKARKNLEDEQSKLC